MTLDVKSTLQMLNLYERLKKLHKKLCMTFNSRR